MTIESIGRRVAKAIAGGRFADTKIKVAVLSSFLTDMLCDVLSAFLLKRGIAAEIFRGPYGATATELLAANSFVNGCDILLVLPTYRDLTFAPAAACSSDEATACVDRETAFWAGLWKHFLRPIVQLSFDPPPYRPMSEADGFRPGGLLRHARCVNQRLADLAPSRVMFVDAEALAGRLAGEWHDARTYQLCKQPFSASAAPEVADTLAAAIAGQLGKARKVLVLDLDNTLWGGVVGDVGLEGLVLGKETAEGEAFVAVQSYAKALAGRGVILAVCSKNTEDIARAPFRSHSGMVLAESDIACFVANFEDKATNLRMLAQTLNVGLDSLVFVDDNPVERAWVKQELPEVLVIDLPDDPAFFCDAIERAKPFPLHRLTAEDTQRNASYRARAQVVDAQNAARDMSTFLKELKPIAVVEEVKESSLDRIVQLLAKTNQFKLNPRLFSAEEISARLEGVFALRFADRLQDYGIVAVAVVEVDEGEAVILNWVMSCRVFSRRLEYAMLELIRRFASRKAATEIRAPFKLSAKNEVARDALHALGFFDDGKGSLRISVLPGSPLQSHYIRLEGV